MIGLVYADLYFTADFMEGGIGKMLKKELIIKYQKPFKTKVVIVNERHNDFSKVIKNSCRLHNIH